MAKKREKLVQRIETLEQQQKELYKAFLDVATALEETESQEAKQLKALLKVTTDQELATMLQSKLDAIEENSGLSLTIAINRLQELTTESMVKRFLRLGITTYLNGETWNIKVD